MKGNFGTSLIQSLEVNFRIKVKCKKRKEKNETISIYKKYIEPLTNVFQQNSEGTITFKIVPADSKGGIRESKVNDKTYKTNDDA